MKALTEPPARADAKRPAPVKHTDTVRVFFALWPQPGIQRKLHAVAKEYQAKCDARVMHADTLHMTLQFIGNIKHTQLPQLIKAAGLVSDVPSFNVVLDKLDFWKHNRIGYATLTSKNPTLDMLVEKLQQALTASGIASDGAKFTPHVTLLRNIEHIPESQNFLPLIWQVNSFVLVESEIINQNAHYKILKELPLSMQI